MSGCLDCDRPCQGARCEHCSVEHAAATDHDTGECPSCGEDTVPDGVRCQDCLPNDHDLRADGGQPAEEETAGTLRCDSVSDEYGDKPWRDEHLLRELYLEEKMSAPEISEELDCGATTVRNWLHRHDIPVRSISEAHKVKGDPVAFWTRTRGHEVWCESFGGQENVFVYVHRLAAMAWHGVEETANADIIHHENEIPWDNREENLKLIQDRGDHFTEHRKFNDLQRLRVAELYANGDLSSRDFADWLDYDISATSVRDFYHEAYGGEASA